MDRPEPVESDISGLYLELLKRCLTRAIDEREYEEPALFNRFLRGVGRFIQLLPNERSLHLVREVDPGARGNGRYWPLNAETMVGIRRLDNVQFCIADVVRNSVPGDLIETGVWQGGVTIFMRGVLKAYGETGRTVWVADSFQGLPPSNAPLYPADAVFDWSRFRTLAVPLAKVQENFRRYGLLDDQVRFLPGWFRETLPSAPIERLAVLRLDGDMYESTMDALGALYPKLSAGGYAIIDDYGLVPTCRQAVEDYRREHGIANPIQEIDGDGVFWQKS